MVIHVGCNYWECDLLTMERSHECLIQIDSYELINAMGMYVLAPLGAGKIQDKNVCNYGLFAYDGLMVAMELWPL